MRKRILKHLSLAIITSGFVINAYAVDPGFYLGLMVGPASSTGGTQQAQIEDSADTTPVDPSSNPFGSRLFMGYKINQFAGVEGGLTYFSKITYDTKDPNVETCNSPEISVRDFDLVAKGMIPLRSFEIYGKAGLAIVYTTTSGSLNPGTGDPNIPTECGKSENAITYRPTVSAGVSYDLSQNWVADVSWNRIMVGDKVSNMDFFALGFSYHFVDIYCGQFLCDG